MSTIELIVALILLMPMILAAVSLLLMALWSWVGGRMSFPRMVIKPAVERSEETYVERRARLLDAVAVIAISVLCLYLLKGTLRSGYPRSYIDATMAYYVAKVEMLMTRFSFYTNSWNLGHEILRFYPPLSTLIPYALARATGAVLPTYYVLCFLAYTAFCVGLYFFVRDYLGSFPAGLYAGLVWAVVHVNVVSFQGHYWETCRLFGTCAAPWALYTINRALKRGGRTLVPVLLVSYIALSNLLSLFDFVIMFIPFLLIGFLMGMEEWGELRDAQIKVMKLFRNLLVGSLGLTLWWLIPAFLPYGTGKVITGFGAPPPLLQFFTHVRPPEWMPATQLPVVIIGLIGALMALYRHESKGVTLLMMLLLSVGAYYMKIQSVRILLMMGLSFTLLGAYLVHSLPSHIYGMMSRVSRSRAEEARAVLEGARRGVERRLGIRFGAGILTLIAATVVTLTIVTPMLVYYAPMYSKLAVVNYDVLQSDEYITARWLWEHAGTSYRVYVMWGDCYRGSQWVNMFYPQLMQTLGGEAPMNPDVTKLDYLVKWSGDAESLYALARKYNLKYIVIDAEWMRREIERGWMDPSCYDKFLNQTYFRKVEDPELSGLKYAEVFEVVGVEPVSNVTLHPSYNYWDIYRIVGLAASALLSAFYVKLEGIGIEDLLKVKLPKIPVVRRPAIPTLSMPTLMDILLLSAATLAVGWAVGALSGFPKGVDAYCHLTRVKFILRFWPNYLWNHLWDAGTPMFGGTYPPLGYYMTAVVAALFRCGPETALTAVATLSFVMNSLCVYGFVRNATGRRLPSILAVMLMVLSPAYWDWWVSGGNYGRVISLGLFGLSLYLASCHIKRPESRLFKTLLPLSIAGNICCHIISGIPALAAISAMLLFFSKDLKSGVVRALKLVASVAGLDAFFITRFLFSNPTAHAVKSFIVSYPPVPVIKLFAPAPHAGFPIHSLVPSMMPIFVFSALFAVVRKVLKRPSDLRAGPYVFCNALVSAAFLGYAFAGYVPWYPKTLYIVGFMPISAMCMVSVALAPLTSIMLWTSLDGMVSKRVVSLLFASLIISTAVLGSIMSVPAVKSCVEDETSPETFETLTMSLITVDEGEVNHRLGTSSAFVSIWFSYVYTVPQTRGYYAPPYLDWHVWFEYAVWSPKDNYGETAFLLDWYAVKWVVVGEPGYHYEKFLSKPDSYRPISNLDDWWEFEYLNATPILSATSTPSILFIGSDVNYDMFIRAIAVSNVNTRVTIPVKGWSRYVDDYSLEELRKFDALFLYGYDYRDSEEAFSLLRQYVAGGGSVFLETNGSPDYDKPYLPEPFPVNNTVAITLGASWSLAVSETNVTAGIDFTKFSPPVYEGGPWGFSTTTAVRPWAIPALTTAGSPIIVVGRYGSGRVVWSGMNLVYHILYYGGNREEAKFLKNIIVWLVGQAEPPPAHEVSFLNPQKRVVRVDEHAKGVLFKESYVPGWGASARMPDGSSEKLRVYMAGPGLMYVPLPEVLAYPVTVTLTYRLPVMCRVGNYVSIATLIALAAYPFLLKLFRRGPEEHPPNRSEELEDLPEA